MLSIIQGPHRDDIPFIESQGPGSDENETFPALMTVVYDVESSKGGAVEDYGLSESLT
jgi:hypothetical protein